MIKISIEGHISNTQRFSYGFVVFLRSATQLHLSELFC